MPVLRTAVAVSAAVLVATLAACAPDLQPTGPQPPDQPAGLAAQAFQLSINTSTGHITVTPPAGLSASRRSRPSFSLLGTDAVTMHASDCAFTPLPPVGHGKSRHERKRCTFTLSLENRLQITDLITPTSFPHPPEGSGGLLAFPYMAGALGVPGGGATPSPDWDQPATNFFNDLGSCSGGTSDCYPWKQYASPLYGGETSEALQVGFDVDADAGSVATYVVVAADLRDNPVQTVTLAADPANCGTISGGSATFTQGELRPYLAFDADRALCSFVLPASLAGSQMLSATLQLTQTTHLGDIVLRGPLVVERIPFTPVTSADFDVAPVDGLSSTVSGDPALDDLHESDVTPTVATAIGESATGVKFRIRWTDEHIDAIQLNTGRFFAGTAASQPPQLVIRYRNP